MRFINFNEISGKEARKLKQFEIPASNGERRYYAISDGGGTLKWFNSKDERNDFIRMQRGFATDRQKPVYKSVEECDGIEMQLLTSEKHGYVTTYRITGEVNAYGVYVAWATSYHHNEIMMPDMISYDNARALEEKYNAMITREIQHIVRQRMWYLQMRGNDEIRIDVRCEDVNQWCNSYEERIENYCRALMVMYKYKTLLEKHLKARGIKRIR